MDKPSRLIFVSALAVLSLGVVLALAARLCAEDKPAIFPLNDVKPGMKGYFYTIFEGDQVEKVELEVIGVLHNAVGPKQDVILVRLLGDKVQQTGVVAGMSGSPVYFDGKLAGALALKLGSFTKEAIGGVTPIASMLEVENAQESPAATASPAASTSLRGPEAADGVTSRVPLPADFATRVAAGSNQFLVPIETPLIAAGLYPETLQRFGREFASWGMAVMPGGTAAASPEDAQLKPGDMVGIDLIRGDLSVSAGCSVTAVDADRVLACGHPLFGFGAVQIPLSRAHVLMTLASADYSTKVISTGATIGTLTQDRPTAVMGKLGAGPPMVPLNVTLDTPDGAQQYHFEVFESPQLTATLVATAAYNGIIGSPVYGEGTTLQLDGAIDLKGHTPLRFENLFAPTDQATPAGFFLATDVQTTFARIYSNPYELPKVEKIDLHIKALPERRAAVIDNAWVEKSEARPGEAINVKVLLRPYRGAPFVQQLPITIPEQSARGALELVVSDAAFLNRSVQFAAASAQAQLPGLEELIALMNRERHNDRLYAALVQPTPTVLVEDKEMPNAPLSAISVLDQRQNSGAARLLWQSTEGEWSVDMHQVISGQRILTITVK